MADALVPPFLKATLFFVKKTEIARNLNTRLNNLQRKLSTTQAVIRQADQQQTECEVVKNWLNELQDIACDTEKVRVKLERHKIRGGVITRFKIGNKMKNAEERVDAIIKEIVQSEPIAGAVILLTGSFPTESEAYRRDGAPPTTFSRPPTVIPAATTPPQTPAAPMAPTAVTESYVYGQVTTSNLVIEETIQMILDMGGGSWDRDTVVRALRAAYNDPERAVEYLYSGIPVQAEVAPIVARTPPGWQVAYPPPAQATQQVQPARPSSRPNVNPQGIPSMGSNTGAGTLDFLRTSQQFHALRAMVQANPQILQPMLQELGKQNPPLMRLIQEHQADFLRLINEPVERVEGESDVYGQATSNLVTGNSFEETIQYILDFGGGTWDRDTVVWALRAASNNPERAIEYLYYGIPVQAEVASAVARPPPGVQAAYPPPAQATQPAQPAQPAVPSSGPNANPLNLFPQGVPSMGSNTGAGTLDFLRTSQQFQALRAMVQANPQILQPMLQEVGKQNPPLMRLIQEHQADFFRLINEPIEEEEGSILGQFASTMPQAVTVTPKEREAIERLEAMGFDRAIVLEVFFACNKNEDLAADHLLSHIDEFEE